MQIWDYIRIHPGKVRDHSCKAQTLTILLGWRDVILDIDGVKHTTMEGKEGKGLQLIQIKKRETSKLQLQLGDEQIN